MNDIATGVLCLSTSIFVLVWAYNMYKSQCRTEATYDLGYKIVKGYAITGAVGLLGVLGLGINDMRVDEKRRRESSERVNPVEQEDAARVRQFEELIQRVMRDNNPIGRGQD